MYVLPLFDLPNHFISQHHFTSSANLLIIPTIFISKSLKKKHKGSIINYHGLRLFTGFQSQNGCWLKITQPKLISSTGTHKLFILDSILTDVAKLLINDFLKIYQKINTINVGFKINILTGTDSLTHIQIKKTTT